MTSPTPATRRFDPPSTLMHWTRLAPLLSATSSWDCIWIIDPVPSQRRSGTRPGSSKKSVSYGSDVGFDGRALAGLDAIDDLPGLELGDRRGLFDPHGLAGLERVGFVVGVVLLRAADDLPVEGMLHLAL